MVGQCVPYIGVTAYLQLDVFTARHSEGETPLRLLALFARRTLLFHPLVQQQFLALSTLTESEGRHPALPDIFEEGFPRNPQVFCRLATAHYLSKVGYYTSLWRILPPITFRS